MLDKLYPIFCPSLVGKTTSITWSDIAVVFRQAMKNFGILVPVLGFTWIFGILSINEDTEMFQYLFTISSSLQVNTGIHVYIYIVCFGFFLLVRNIMKRFIYILITGCIVYKSFKICTIIFLLFFIFSYNILGTFDFPRSCPSE